MKKSDWTIREITPDDDAEALALEQRCPQGKAFRILFRRDRFRARTDAFQQAKLLGAWRNGRLCAVGGGAIKDVAWCGRTSKSLMLYDFRVDPEHRREGVGRTLTETLLEWSPPEAEVGMAFAVGDNLAIQAMALNCFGCGTAPAFDLVAFPTSAGKFSSALRPAHAPFVRTRHLASSVDTSLICDASHSLASRQLVGSWTLGDRATCSAWSSAGMLEEKIVGLPLPLRMASWLLGGESARRLGLPHVPRIGETLRSWLIVDLDAATARDARNLVQAVASEAVRNGVDHCHVVLPQGSAYRNEIRKAAPRGFAPVIPFTLMARTRDGDPLSLSNPVIDPADI